MTLQSCRYTWQAFKAACDTFVKLLGGDGFIIVRYVVDNATRKSCNLGMDASLYGILPKSLMDNVLKHAKDMQEKYGDDDVH